jgi:hypothetical protein
MSIRQWMTSTTARTMLVTMMMASTTRVPPSSHPPAPSCAIRITKAEITFPQVWHSQRTTFHTLFFPEAEVIALGVLMTRPKVWVTLDVLDRVVVNNHGETCTET